MKPPRAFTATILAAALPFTGCQTYEEYGLTHKLWTDASLTDHHLPAATATVRSFQLPQSARLQVSYDERREKDYSVRRRAFFLPDSARQLAEGRKPDFASPTPPAGAVEVPVIVAGELAPNAPVYLQLAADYKSFTVVRGGIADGPHKLPTYVDQSSTAFRAAMTPFAVAADVTVVAVWCGIVALYAYAHTPLSLR